MSAEDNGNSQHCCDTSAVEHHIESDEITTAQNQAVVNTNVSEQSETLDDQLPPSAEQDQPEFPAQSSFYLKLAPQMSVPELQEGERQPPIYKSLACDFDASDLFAGIIIENEP